MASTSAAINIDIDLPRPNRQRIDVDQDDPEASDQGIHEGSTITPRSAKRSWTSRKHRAKE